MNYGDKIASLRRAKGMTQAELGNALNVTYQAVSKWERNESLPDFETMSRLARLFGVSLTYFEEGIEESRPPSWAERTGKPLIGFCAECRRAVFEGDGYVTLPVLRCQSCNDALNERERFEREIKENICKAKELEQKNEAALRITKLRKQRNRGFIVAAVCTAFLAAGMLFNIIDGTFVKEDLPFGIAAIVFLFPFISQLFWNGAVKKLCLGGGSVYDLLMLAFHFSRLSVVLLIVLNVLYIAFRLLVLLFVLLCFLCCIIAACLLSPFTFMPALIRVNRQCK